MTPPDHTHPPTWILGLNAFGFLSRMASTDDCRVASFSRLLKQFTQLQLLQYRPDAKHSQYLHMECQTIQKHNGLLCLKNYRPNCRSEQIRAGSIPRMPAAAQ